jgi:hypothetical protein
MQPLPDSDPQPIPKHSGKTSWNQPYAWSQSCGCQGCIGCLGLLILLIISPFVLIHYILYWRPYFAARTGTCGTEAEMYPKVTSQGESSVSSYARAQQDFYFEKQRFSKMSGSELNKPWPSKGTPQNELGIAFGGRGYRFLTHVNQNMAIIHAISEKPGETCLRNYVGAVLYTRPAEEKTSDPHSSSVQKPDSKLSQSRSAPIEEFQQVVCSSKQPVEGMIPNPIVKDGKLFCSPDTIQVE